MNRGVPKLPDPERCRICHAKGSVVRSWSTRMCRKRRRCCNKCGFRWTTFETVLNPRLLRARETVSPKQV